MALTKVNSGGINFETGAVLQVVQTSKTDVFSETIGSGATTGVIMSVALTPSSTSSKVMLFGSISSTTGTDGQSMFIKVLRGSTQIALGDANSSNQRSTSGGLFSGDGGRGISTNPIQFLDSPSSTSAVTYNIKMGTTEGTNVIVYVNRGRTTGSGAEYGRFISTLTAMEVAG